MDLIGSRRRRKHKTIIPNRLIDLYPHELQLYSLPPGNEIQLDEFEQLALERLQLFRIIEQASQRGLRLYTDEWKDCIYADLLKNQLKKYYKLAKLTTLETPTDADLQARRADHISHFILRIAYCRTEPLRKWFLARELEWFKLRFQQCTTKSIDTFIKLNNLTYEPISSEEKSQFYEELTCSTVGMIGKYDFDSLNFYKVPFMQVPSLVKSRRVFLNKGFAFVPSFELVTCILGIFRTALNEALVYANRKLPLMDDDRINFLIGNLPNIYTGKNYNQNTNAGTVGLTNLDTYAGQHFPLCMSHMYGLLKANNHLKHECRVMLGLFLKGIGLTYEESMTFWKSEFTKKMDSEKFDKSYAYNIKHSYGLNGAKINYTPYSCIKIISCSVGPGQQHGCPYKHWDSTFLKSKLRELGITSEGVQDIAETAAKGHFQVACGKYFDYFHGEQNKSAINHPNQYVEESLELSKDTKEKTPSTPKVVKKSKPADTNTDTNVTVDDINWDEDM